MKTLLLGGLITLTLSGATFTRTVPDDAEPGLYTIAYRLEMPHLERYAVERVVERCLGPTKAMPIVGAGSTFTGCPVSPPRREGSTLHIDTACEGRAAARARATYRFSGETYHARVAITLGAKNMTMVEVQKGTRIGPCA